MTGRSAVFAVNNLRLSAWDFRLPKNKRRRQLAPRPPPAAELASPALTAYRIKPTATLLIQRSLSEHRISQGQAFTPDSLRKNSPVKLYAGVSLRSAQKYPHLAQSSIIVGYSLPSTDIYMQYFMKSALGPNLLLNKIFVYNPAVAEMAPAAAEARQRYETCFSAQLRSRIDFSPPSALRHSTAPLPRTTVDFVRTIASEPRSILF